VYVAVARVVVFVADVITIVDLRSVAVFVCWWLFVAESSWWLEPLACWNTTDGNIRARECISVLAVSETDVVLWLAIAVRST